MKCKEAVFMAVSYRPDEGAFLETGHVLLKKIVAQPLRERQTVATRMLQKFLPRWPPSIICQTL
jgi:hypothetical protein